MEDAKNIAKNYNPAEFEDKLYNEWVEKGYFHAEVDKNKKPFTIVIPPPNVTGQLHMGHALDETLQDILIRYKRMQGYSALWIPGTDHAGIATQIKVEENLRVNEGLTRYDLGREKFLERVWDWKKQYGGRIINQLKKIGSSCDWDRERFTMDEGCSKAVKEVFVNLYNKGLIYQGSRIINWCPHCITALSDAEVEHAEQAGHFWHIKYPIKDSDDYVIIATTRPETLFGDTAVAVNPEDERYKDLVGKMLVLPLVGREIPVFWRRSTPLWWRWSKARLPRRRRPCVSVICSSKMHICSRNMARQACAPRYRRDIRPVTAVLPTVLERAALHALPGSALLWEAVFPRFRRAARPPFRERRAAEPLVRETWWSIKFSAAARC